MKDKLKKSQAVVVAAPVSSLSAVSGRSIMRTALGEYRRHLKRYLLLIAIVTVPNTAISLTALASDVSISFYVQLAALFMTTGLLWAVTHQEDLVGLAVRRSYYEGSSLLVRLLLLAPILVAMAIPAGLGLNFYTLGTTGDSQASLPIYLILSALAVVLAIPTFALLVRFGWSIFAVSDGDSPIAALRSSGRLTRGRFWLTARRSVIILLLLLAMILPVAVIVILLILFLKVQLFGLILQLFVSFTVIPVAVLAFYRLYRLLQEA
jgi:hypothetical protein